MATRPPPEGVLPSIPAGFGDTTRRLCPKHPTDHRLVGDAGIAAAGAVELPPPCDHASQNGHSRESHLRQPRVDPSPHQRTRSWNGSTSGTDCRQVGGDHDRRRVGCTPRPRLSPVLPSDCPGPVVLAGQAQLTGRVDRRDRARRPGRAPTGRLRPSIGRFGTRPARAVRSPCRRLTDPTDEPTGVSARAVLGGELAVP